MNNYVNDNDEKRRGIRFRKLNQGEIMAKQGFVFAAEASSLRTDKKHSYISTDNTVEQNNFEVILVYPDKQARLQASPKSEVNLNGFRIVNLEQLDREIAASTRFGIGVPLGHEGFFHVAMSVITPIIYDLLDDPIPGALIRIDRIDYEIEMDFHPRIYPHDLRLGAHAWEKKRTIDWLLMQFELVLIARGDRRMLSLQLNRDQMVTYSQFESVPYDY